MLVFIAIDIIKLQGKLKVKKKEGLIMYIRPSHMYDTD